MITLIGTLLALAVQGPDTVRLTVADAIAGAEERNPTLAALRADARAAAQGPLAATQAFLPTVRAETQGVRTTDPVAVFGLKLRQATFAAEDLALDALNHPEAFRGYSSGLTIELPIFAPEGVYGFRSARAAAEASLAGAERATGATAFGVTQAYWDAQVAEGRVAALDAALEAALGHARQADALREQGLVTGLDARLARLGASRLETARIGALAEAENALSRLRALMNIPEDTPLRLTDSLPRAPGPTLCPDSESCPVATRGDVRALAAGARAADLARKSALAAQLPQIATFAAITHHGASNPWGEGSGDWSVGIGLSWSVFPGLGGVAQVRRASAEREAARSRYEASVRQAEVEALQARRLLDAAARGSDIAANAQVEALAAVQQAEARYRTGASSITELLDVQAAATNVALDLLEARRGLALALAALELAYGVNDR